MAQNSKFSNVLMESLLGCSDAERLRYLQSIFGAPTKIKSIFFAPETTSYVVGFLKSHDISLDYINILSLSIVRILAGDKSFVQLPGMLATELKLPNDKAQKMAAEIEKDLFGPVRQELDEFIRKQKVKGGSMVNKSSGASPISKPHPTSPFDRSSGLRGARNLLNLKELNAPKRPGQLPPKPASSVFLADKPQPTPPKFPLPPLRPSGSAGQAPNPIRFT